MLLFALRLLIIKMNKTKVCLNIAQGGAGGAEGNKKRLWLMYASSYIKEILIS